MNVNYDNIVNTQAVREDLIEYVKNNEYGLTTVAYKIGISFPTFRKVINGDPLNAISCWIKIEKFLASEKAKAK